MDNRDKDIKAQGFVVGGDYGKNGNYFWAEIEPSGGRWYRQFLPWVRRWWFEINETEKVSSDELKIGTISHAYTDYGSNGSYTLRGCVIKAQLAIEKAAEHSSDTTEEIHDEPTN